MRAASPRSGEIPIHYRADPIAISQFSIILVSPPILRFKQNLFVTVSVKLLTIFGFPMSPNESIN